MRSPRRTCAVGSLLDYGNLIFSSNLISRATKLVVTLLQDKASNGIGDNVNAMEGSQELCDQCQIGIESLFILQQTEFMPNHIKR